MCILNAAYLPFVVNAYIQRTALRIRKAAYILQVFVSPGLLEFYVLVLFHLCI